MTGFFTISIFTSPVVGLLTLCVPYFFILLVGVLILISSNLLYGFASHAWMVLLSRFLLGIGFQAINVITISYIGYKESDYIKAYGEHMEKTMKEKDPEHKLLKVEIKKTLIAVNCISIFLPLLIGPGKYNSYGDGEPPSFSFLFPLSFFPLLFLCFFLHACSATSMLKHFSSTSA